MTTSRPARPLPEPTIETKPFWDGCKAHVLLLPTCTACGRPHFYPRPLCPHCFGSSFEWTKASGRGTLYSFAIEHQPLPGLGQNPLVVALVDLEEGVRVLSNLVGIEPDPGKINVGMPVEVVFEDVAPEVTLFKFRPADGRK